MKRCRRCHREINKKEKYCPSCGFKSGINSFYYSANHVGKGRLPNYGYSYKNNNKNNSAAVGCIIIAFVFFYIAIIVVSLLTSVFEIEKEKDMYFEINSDEINAYLYNTKLIAEDYYKTWTYSIDEEITIEDIENFTSLKRQNLTNSYCALLEIDFSVDNAKKCVKRAHEEIGTYLIASEDLEMLYGFIIDNELTQIQYDILSEIYDYGVDLFYISYEYEDYSTFEKKYNNYIVELEILIEGLDNRTA